MTEIKILILFLVTSISVAFQTSKAQVLIPEDLPGTGELIFLKQSDSRLWAIQMLPTSAKYKSLTVSVKTGNQWGRLPNLNVVTQANSKGIRISDVEIYGNRIYISGDFQLNGKNSNCLAYIETSGTDWSGDHIFNSAVGSPAVNSLAELDNKLYLGGIFNKINSSECINLAKIDKTNTPAPVKVKQFNGANGVINGLETDSTRASLIVGGLFRNVLGQSINGLAKYTPADSSVLKITADITAVFQMNIVGSTLLLHGVTDSSKPKSIYIYNGTLKDASGIDSLQDVNSLFGHKGHFYFTGSARLSGSNRETGMFEFSLTNKTHRVYSKFGKITLAAGYNDFIYISGSVLNVFTGSNEYYNIGRIDENYQRFYGRVFYDANSNGQFNPGVDIRVGGRDARVLPYGTLVPIERTGWFSFIIPKGKSVLIAVSIPKSNELSSEFIYKFNADTFTERIVDFPLKFVKSNFSDVKVSVTAAAGWRCRKDTSELYVVKLSNEGLVNVQPDLKLNFNSKIVLIKPFPAPDIIDPGKLTWSSQGLEPGDERTYLIKLTTPGTDFSDKDQLSFSASVSGVADDNPVNNSDTLHQTVSSGVAPNAKYQYPEAASGDTVAWLTSNAGKMDYVIRFTNNTTDTLTTVVVRDTIATPDYVTYIKETGSSHPFTRSVYTTPSLPEKVIVAYTFSNIKLPPVTSGNNEQVNSSGYIGFQLGLTPNLSSGTNMRNRASIYMDNYTPIITNTVVAYVASSANHYLSTTDFSVYPNPATDRLFFTKPLKNGLVRIFDMKGKEVLNQTITGNYLSFEPNMAPGSYFWNVYSNNGTMYKGIFIKNQ